MTTFDKREEGFERKFALDEELKFKAYARRNRLLGLWAAEKLGMSGEAANAYAKAGVAADFGRGDCAARNAVAREGRPPRLRSGTRRGPQGPRRSRRQRRRPAGRRAPRKNGRADGR